MTIYLKVLSTNRASVQMSMYTCDLNLPQHKEPGSAVNKDFATDNSQLHFDLQMPDFELRTSNHSTSRTAIEKNGTGSKPRSHPTKAGWSSRRDNKAKESPQEQPPQSEEKISQVASRAFLYGECCVVLSHHFFSRVSVCLFSSCILFHVHAWDCQPYLPTGSRREVGVRTVADAGCLPTYARFIQLLHLSAHVHADT